MRVPAIHTTSAEKVVVRAATSRLVNPITGYALAAVISAALWGLLLSVIF